MNNVIFFREENENELSGPFTEREMQQLYRAKKFSPTTEIYFTKETMLKVTAKSYLLVQLRSRCGIGCPFINPETLPAKLGRTATKDELRVMGIQIGIKGIREQVEKVFELEEDVEYLEHLEERLKALLTKDDRHMSIEQTQERKKKNDKKKKMESVSLLLDEFPTKFGLNREQRMQRLESDLISIRSSFSSLLSLKWNVKKAEHYCRNARLELMGNAAAKITPPSAPAPKKNITKWPKGKQPMVTLTNAKDEIVATLAPFIDLTLAEDNGDLEEQSDTNDPHNGKEKQGTEGVLSRHN